jgi:branched-chain amino acid transport system substrate-binding protein
MKMSRRAAIAAMGGIAVAPYLSRSGLAQTKDPIRVGMLQMLTSDLAQYGLPLRDAGIFAVDEINAAGGINGRRIQVFLEDVGGTPQGSVQAALRLIQRDQVQIIMQGGTSGHTLATIPVVDQNQVPMVNMSTAEAITQQGSQWTFRAARVPNSVLDRKFAQYVVKEMKVQRIAVIYGNDEMGRDASNNFVKSLTELGVQPVSNEQIQVGDADVSAQVTRVLSSRPNAVFIQGHTNESSKIVRTLRQLSRERLQILGFDQMATAQFIERAGGCSALAGLIYRTGNLGEQSQDPSMKSFIQRWKAKYPAVDTLLPMVQYAGMQVMFEALRLAGDNLSRVNIRDSFYKIQNYGSILGPINVEKNGETQSTVHILRFDDNCKQQIVRENFA